MIRDRIDVAIIDATQADAIAAVAASWEIARAKINLCRRSPLYSPQISAVSYIDNARWMADKDFWSKRGVETRCILEGIDVEEITSAAPNRSGYGIPDSAVVLATAGQDLDHSISEEFVETMVSVLRSHPHAIYLLVGEAELSWQKRKFESAGVGKRIGYAGRRKDLPGFLRIADVYVSEPGSRRWRNFAGDVSRAHVSRHRPAARRPALQAKKPPPPTPPDSSSASAS